MTPVESFAAEPPPLRVNGDGVILVGKTRVPLDTVVGEYEDGATPEEIVYSFSSLDLADVYAVISYYLRHRSEVEAYLKGRCEHVELEWAAEENRILLTHDAATVTRFAYERVRAGLRMPGVFEVSRSMPVGQAIDQLLLAAECSLDGEWQGQVRYFPL